METSQKVPRIKDVYYKYLINTFDLFTPTKALIEIDKK
jgi:hypothetical protein